MASYLFFDDQRLYVRENLTREMGPPELIPDSLYGQQGAEPSGAMARVWKENDHAYHLFYQAFLPNRHTVLLAAFSRDGIHFAPRNTAREAGIEEPLFENQLVPERDAELASFIDTGKGPGRLKLLVSEYLREDRRVRCKIYTSDDGIRWTLSPYTWHEVGTEPCASVFYSAPLDEYVLLSRPDWGSRRVCESRTKDFRTFSKPAVMMQADALDEPLCETYGLTGFPYKDVFAGVLLMYHTVPSDGVKYMDGKLDGQLVYSLDGAHWMRSLRCPFMKNEPPFEGMLFTSDMRVEDDGSILLYASGTCREHGHFHEPGGKIGVFRLREDGFFCLKTDGEGRLRTRDTLLKGAFHVNLKAEKATCALFTAQGEPIPGFTHEDCEPFEGDSTRWEPRFKQDIGALAGKVVDIEIRMRSGRLYGITGDFVKMMNMETSRYLNFGTLPFGGNL